VLIIIVCLRVCVQALTVEDIAAIDAAGAAGTRRLAVKKMLKRAAVGVLVGAAICHLLHVGTA
jgi:hypothetical protein